jgi:hypothetical protein
MSWSHFIKNPSYGEANYVDGEKSMFQWSEKNLTAMGHDFYFNGFEHTSCANVILE